MNRTPITPIRLPLDIKTRIRKQSRNVSSFMISATLDKLDLIEGEQGTVQQKKKEGRYNTFQK